MGALGKMKRLLAKNSIDADALSQKYNIDRRFLAEHLLIEYAFSINRGGIVIASMFREDHLRMNCRIADKTHTSSFVVDDVRKLIDDDRRRESEYVRSFEVGPLLLTKNEEAITIETRYRLRACNKLRTSACRRLSFSIDRTVELALGCRCSACFKNNFLKLCKANFHGQWMWQRVGPIG